MRKGETNLALPCSSYSTDQLEANNPFPSQFHDISAAEEDGTISKTPTSS